MVSPVTSERESSPADDTVAGHRLDGIADVGQRGAELVGHVLGVGSEHRADDHDRGVRVALADDVEERLEPFGDHAHAVGYAGPATLPVGDGDDLGPQSGDVLRRDDLAATGAGVAHVDQVDPGLPGGDGGPSLDGPEAIQPWVVQSP